MGVLRVQSQDRVSARGSARAYAAPTWKRRAKRAHLIDDLGLKALSLCSSHQPSLNLYSLAQPERTLALFLPSTLAQLVLTRST